MEQWLNKHVFSSCEKRKSEKEKNFKAIKDGFITYTNNLSETLGLIENWDELININDRPIRGPFSMRNKTINYKFKDLKYFFAYCGFIFCIIQLMGVQLEIILLGALFSEITDEIKLWAINKHRKYNFYEKIEISSYKSIPEIDVGMITSSIGLIVLKQYGFRKSYSIFHLLSSILFTLLLLNFNFHTGDKLLENYNSLEISLLIITYIILSILVGGSSILSLKEFYEIFSKVLCQNKPKQEEQENLSNDSFRLLILIPKCFNMRLSNKIIFYVYPSLSLIFIVLINRKIFKTFKDITSKNILIAIIIIIYLCYILSFIFHCLFTCSIIEKNNKIKNEKWNSKNNINIDKNIDNIKSKRYSENTIIKFSNKDNSKIEKEYHEEIIEMKQDKKKIYSTKICTLCGYIYLRKEIGDTKACVCYYYTNKCNWFLDIICKFEVITSILIEFN